MLPLPPDFDENMILNVVTAKQGPAKHTSILTFNVAVEDCDIKKYGPFTDTYRGRVLAYAQDSDGNTPKHIAIKRVRFNHKDNQVKQKILSTFAAAEDRWSTFNHPNLCPVWALTSLTGPIPAVAMPWFDNGNVLEFTHRNPGADKLDIVKQLASAVCYIHAMNDTHGNILPTNVMISDDGTPHLTDVGLRACLVKVICGDRRPILPGWMFKAPEELQFQCEPISFVNTKAMDVYALGTTIYTIFISGLPLTAKAEYRCITEIIARGHELRKPACITDPLWNLLQRCWSYDPEDRPSVMTVGKELEML